MMIAPKQVSTLVPSQTQEIYVSAGGSDTLNDGSILRPFATIAHAMTSVPDASVQRLICVGPGLYADSIALKPNVFIVGAEDSETAITGSITLDGSWTAAFGSVSGLQNIQWQLPSAQTLDFSEINASGANLVFSTVSFVATGLLLSFIANDGVGSSLTFEQCRSNAAISIDGFGSRLLNQTMRGNFATLTVTSTKADQNATADLIGGGSEGAVIFTNAVNTSTLGVLVGFAVRFALTINGLATTVSATSESIAGATGVHLTGGALASQLVYLTFAPAVGFVPTTAANWPTPTPDNVQQALDDLASRALLPSFLTASKVSANALNAYDATGLPEGTIAFVQSVQDYYGWQPGSALTADGINVVASTVGTPGQWLRLYEISLVWTHQSAWFVDPSNVSGLASDENTGVDATHPLLTFAELRNRFGNGSFLANPTITVMSSAPVPANDPIIFNCNFSAGYSLIGTPTLGPAISLGTVTPPVKTGATAHGWWASGVSGLTGLFNDNTANNARFWADATILGGAGINTIITVPTSPVATNDTVQLLTLPSVQFGTTEAPSFRCIINVSQLSFTNSIFAGEALNAQDCQFDNTCDVSIKGATFNNCAGLIPGSQLSASTNAVLEYSNGYFNLPANGRALSTGLYYLSNFTTPDLKIEVASTTCLYSEDLILGGPRADTSVNGALLAMLNNTSLAALVEDTGTCFLYGSTAAATAHGARLENGCTLTYGPGNPPQLFCPGNDFTVSGRTATRSFDPNTFLASAANIACTWANLTAPQPAGFGGALQVPAFGILISPST